MKAEDIIKALVEKVPTLTDKFTTQTSIDSITSAGLVATATVGAGHGLVDTELVTVVGAISPISIASIVRTLDTALVTTDTDHDFTSSARERAAGTVQSAVLSGSNEPEFNGSFTIASVTNRRNFIINIADSGATSATGPGMLENGASPLQGYNGIFNITVVSPTVFTYPLLSTVPLAAIGAPILHNGHRISGSVTIERFMDAYTKQQTNDLWMVVVLGDVIASKGRQNRSDSTDVHTPNQYYQQEITQPFGVYIVFPASSSIAGRTQRDEAEDIVPYVMQGVLLKSFPSGFTAGTQYQSTFTAHGFFLYNGPQYIHEVTFEQDASLLFDDSVGEGLHVAFRDVQLTINNDLGTGTDPQLANIDLDETPLP